MSVQFTNVNDWISPRFTGLPSIAKQSRSRATGSSQVTGLPSPGSSGTEAEFLHVVFIANARMGHDSGGPYAYKGICPVKKKINGSYFQLHSPAGACPCYGTKSKMQPFEAIGGTNVFQSKIPVSFKVSVEKHDSLGQKLA
ncbi:hypothetical protein MCOR02_006835 [Pyricularia oryzae]|nr:hypothetical protein MCOR02_006835 [Pyricularia oryzae]KAI6300918.1 hypothetical protein MCOR34_009047 [Pyricularia oryzae]KAI6579793.1 hypothetical protein MCOR04_005927 [Pyricularia oryzae]